MNDKCVNPPSSPTTTDSYDKFSIFPDDDYESGLEMVSNLFEKDESDSKKQIDRNRLSLKKTKKDSKNTTLSTKFRNYFNLESGGKKISNG